MSGSSFLRSLSRGSEEATDSRDSYIRDHLISVDSDSEEDNSQHSGTDWEGRSERGEGGGGGGKSRRKGGPLGNKMLTESELQDMRLKINSRERRRMHDLNSALDGLREVMPYAHGPSVRKLSKIATLLLARNYILMLSSSLDEMKKLISDTYQSHHHHHHHPSRTISAPVLHTHAHAHAHVGSAGGLPPLPSLPTIPPLHMVIPSTMTPFSPHELPSATSMTSKDSSSTPTSMSAHHTAALGADRHVLYGRWPSPCSCTQCSPDAPRAAFHSVGGKYPSPYSSPHTFRK